MGINIGSTPLKGAALGSTQLEGIALGSTLLWRRYRPYSGIAPIGETQLSNSTSWQLVTSLTMGQTLRKPADIGVEITWNGGSSSHKVRIVKNGTVLATSPEQGNGGPNTQTVSATTTLNAGDVLRVEAYTTNLLTPNNRISYGMWQVIEQL